MSLAQVRLHVALVGALTLAALAPLREGRAEPAPKVFDVVVATATVADAGPAVDEAWVTAQISEANQLFAPLGVRFVARAAANLPSELARLETMADRDRLAARMAPRAINVFVVASLRDVDEADRYRMGVHWRFRAEPSRRYVILSSIAPSFVLAHELGHFFGNPHSGTPGNIMSYERTDAAPFFDATQASRIRAAASALVRELSVPSPPPARPRP